MNLAEYETEQFGGLSFDCGCGERHSVETKYFISGREALGRLEEVLLAAKAENLLFVTAEDVYQKYGRSLELLLRKSRRVTVHVFPSGFAPTLLRVSELARYPGADCVVCFGSGSVADVAKYHCSVRGCPLVAVLSAPCADLSGYCNLMLDGRTERLMAASPFAVIADAELVRTAPPAMIASAFGWMAGTGLALFEWKFAHLIGREPYCRTVADFSRALIEEAIEAGEDYVSGNREAAVKLTDCLLRHGACVQLFGSRPAESSATLSAAILQAMNLPKGQGNLLGERVMLAANRLVRLFRTVLSEDPAMPVLPTDKARRAQLLAETCGTNAVRTLRRLYDQPRINLDVAGYKIREFRRELLSDLDRTEKLLVRANRVFKHIYPDGGFWIGRLELPELRRAFYLAPDLSDTFTVLSLMRDMGLLENLLANPDDPFQISVTSR